MEAHVCVFQTAMELYAEGYEVHSWRRHLFPQSQQSENALDRRQAGLLDEHGIRGFRVAAGFAPRAVPTDRLWCDRRIRCESELMLFTALLAPAAEPCSISPVHRRQDVHST
jgi:hypothetical protein